MKNLRKFHPLTKNVLHTPSALESRELKTEAFPLFFCPVFRLLALGQVSEVFPDDPFVLPLIKTGTIRQRARFGLSIIISLEHLEDFERYLSLGDQEQHLNPTT